MATFAHRLPAWTGRDGFPLTWRHYIYGSQYLTRADVRDSLRTASAFRAGQAVPEDFKGWARDMERHT